jgi:2,5-diketo-D-gluconate reductase B
MSQTKLVLPKMGLGTWQLSPEQAEFSVKKGIEIGYRLIDTAQAYKNEQGVGNALKATFETTQFKRRDLIIATKVDVFNLKPKKVIPTTMVSLSKLQLDYVDLLYVHWPAFFFGYRHETSLKEFSKLVDDGKVKNICVSNFSPKLIDDALAVCDKPIFANQVEHHPLLQQREMRKYLKEKGINLVAYSPLAHGKIIGVPELEEIAKKHNVGVAQVSLAWLMNHGAIPIPKATSEKHLISNFESINLNLDTEDIAKIDSISIEKRTLNPPIVKPKKW